MVTLDPVAAGLLGAAGGLALGLLLLLVSRRFSGAPQQAAPAAYEARPPEREPEPPRSSVERAVAQDVSLLVAKRIYEAIRRGEAEVKVVLRGCEGDTVFDFREMRLKCLTEEGVIMAPGEEKAGDIVEEVSFEQAVGEALEEPMEEEEEGEADEEPPRRRRHR